MRDVILNRVIPKQIAQKFQTVMETKMGKHGDIRAAANFQEMFMDFHDDVRLARDIKTRYVQIIDSTQFWSTHVCVLRLYTVCFYCWQCSVC